MDTSAFPPPTFTPFRPVDGFDTDVVVVGLGPAGGTAASALATYGVRVHAMTMFPWVANSPRAHITNQRAVEVLRDLGIEEEARKYATPVGPDGRHPVHHQPGRRGDRPVADLGHRRPPGR